MNTIYSLIKSPIVLLVLVLGTCLMTCGKDSDTQCFDNKTGEPIDLYINDVFESTIDEKDLGCVFLGEGCYDWYAEGVVTGFYSEGTICLSPDAFQTTIVIDD